MSGIHSIPKELLDLIWSFIAADFYSWDIRRTCKAFERVSRKTFMDTFMYKGSLPIIMDELDLRHAMELSTSVCRTSITSTYIFSRNWATDKDLESQVYWVPESLARVDRTVFPQIMSFQENQAKIRETNSDVEMLATIIKNLDCQEITVGLPNFRDGDWRDTYSLRRFNRLLQENGAPSVYYMMARDTLNHVGQIFERVLAATRAAERDVEVTGVAISSAHPPERRTEDFEDGVQKYIAFHRALLKDMDVSFEVQLRLKPIVAGFINPKSLDSGSQSHFLTKLFRTAEYLKLDTPLRCALRDTIPFGEFTNLRRLHLRSLDLSNDPAELVEFILQLPKQMELMELAKLRSSSENYWIRFLTTLANYDLSFQLSFFMLSFDEPHRKGLWCLNGCTGACPPEPERVEKGFHQLRELVVKLHVWQPF